MQAVRAVIILLALPVLRCTGYGLTWREAAMVQWSGLRGAVILALSLYLLLDDLRPALPLPCLLRHGHDCGALRTLFMALLYIPHLLIAFPGPKPKQPHGIPRTSHQQG